MWSEIPHSGIRRRLNQGFVIERRYSVSGRLEARSLCDVYVVRDFVQQDHLTLLVPRREFEGGYNQSQYLSILEGAKRLLSLRSERQCLRALVELDGQFGLITDQWIRRSLVEIISESGPLPERRALSVMLGVARALNEAHDALVSHENLSPESIFVRPGDDHVVVCNFGLFPRPTSKDLDREVTLTETNSQAFLSPYFSPEQISKQHPTDAQTDIWSFGLCLYFALLGRLPFAGESLSGLTSNIDQFKVGDLEELQISPELRFLIIGCLQRQRQRRFPSMNQVIDQLQAIRQSQDTLPDTPPPSFRIRLSRWAARARRSTKI